MLWDAPWLDLSYTRMNPRIQESWNGRPFIQNWFLMKIDLFNKFFLNKRWFLNYIVIKLLFDSWFIIRIKGLEAEYVCL